MTKATILVADNLPEQVEVISEFLESGGYRVLGAYSPGEARQILERHNVHLAILDVRLIDDSDKEDRSGVELAQDPAYRSLLKIMLTGYANTDDVKEVMKPIPGQLPAAVDYFSKKADHEEIVTAVDKVLAQYMRLNRALHIHWDRDQHPLHLASMLCPDLPYDMLAQRAEEMEDLLRRLFLDYRQIRVNRWLWLSEGRICLPVLAELPQGAVDSRLVVCGHRDVIDEERRLVRDLLPAMQDGIQLEDRTETIHYGALAYVLPTADPEKIQRLTDYYPRAPQGAVLSAVKDLLSGSLAAWHDRGRPREAVQDSMSLYRLQAGLGPDDMPRETVKRGVADLLTLTRPLISVEKVPGTGKITFRFRESPPMTYPDPVAVAYSRLELEGLPLLYKLSPGHLTADNILVDGEKGTWLTDFLRAGWVPQWWDHVCLEALVRFDLCPVQDEMALQELEEALVRPSKLSEALGARQAIPDLRKSLAAIEQIRRHAGSEAGTDALPYYAGLLVWTVGAMARFEAGGLPVDSETLAGAHLLLAASMLAARIQELAGNNEPPGSGDLPQEETVAHGELGLAEDGRTLLRDGAPDTVLTGQNHALFQCLYGAEGQVVARETIVKQVFDEAYEPGNKHQAGKLNAVTKRLRDLIEPDPRRPRYILTVRGHGLRLDASGGKESV